ncbi:MAG: hypothetical protein ACYDCF_08225 [Burkholderiales bacterium]
METQPVAVEKVETVKMVARSGMEVEMPLEDFLKFYQEKQNDMVATRQAVLEMAGSRAKADRNIKPYLNRIKEAKAALALFASVIEFGKPDDRAAANAIPDALKLAAQRMADLASDEDFGWLCFRRGSTESARRWVIETPEKWGENEYGPAW